METKILRNISYGVYIVSSNDKGIDAGCIINTLTQITSEGPLISISLNKENYTNEVIKKAQKFAVAIINEEINPNIISTFGFTSSKEIDKFKDYSYEIVDNIKIINEGTCGYLLCEVVNIVDVKTHDVIIARVIDTKKYNDKKEMTYRYYHEVIKGRAPQKAPTYEPNTNEEKNSSGKYKYVCDLCGYTIETDEELPDDYVCPLCGASRSHFIKE